MTCKINLDDFGFESRDQLVLYATHQYIIYQEKQKIYLKNCADHILAVLPANFDLGNYSTIEDDDGFLVITSKHFIYLSRNGNSFIHEVPIDKTGRCVTKVFKGLLPQTVIYGCEFQKKLHLVCYDYINQKRVLQSCSYELNNFTDITMDSRTIYILMDNAVLSSFNAESFELQWNRFEAGNIRPQILSHRNGVYYTIHGLIRTYNGSQTSSERIPTIRVSGLSGILGNNLYLTNADDKNLSCYDLNKKELRWEITGVHKISQTFFVKGEDSRGTYSVLVLRANGHLGVINLDLGKIVLYRQIEGMRRLILTPDHILAQCTNQRTELLPGIIE